MRKLNLFCLVVFVIARLVSFRVAASEVWIDGQGFYYYAVPEKHVVTTDDLTPALRLHEHYPYIRIIPDGNSYRVEQLTLAEFNAIKHLLTEYGRRFRGDFSGDGQPDVLLQTRDGHEILVSKTGQQTFLARQYRIGVQLSADTVFIDKNADGRLDIVSKADGISEGSVAYAQADGFSAFYGQGDYVGSLAGSHNVTPSGEFTYSLPITMAAATGNLTPQLALHYSTGAPNSHLGVGWSIGGLRSIARCEQNLELNGAITKVDFSASDRFCLDGQQLLVKNGQTYGANNAEYRTVQDSFEKVVSKTGSGVNGPVSFEVKDTLGNTYFFGRYGNDNDALILANNNAAFVWALKRVQDASGNYYTFHYAKDSQSLEFWLTSVRYSGNGSITPANEVQFSYEDVRPDKTETYIAGQVLRTTKRLKTITSRANGAILRTYSLNYEHAIASLGMHSVSRLTGVQACDSAGKCLSPTLFGWNLRNLNAWAGGYSGTISRSSRYLAHQMWDYNGDGLPDIAYVRNDRGSSTDHLFLIENTGNNLVERLEIQNIASKSFRATWKIVDLDKDGRDEIIYRGTDGYWYQIKYNGSSFTNSRLTNIPQTSSDAYSHWVDMDGDGLPELMHTVGNQLSVQLGTKTGLDSVRRIVNVHLNVPGPNHSVSLVPFDSEDNTLPATDFNGDGKADFIVQVRETYTDPNPDPCYGGGYCCDPNQPWLCQQPLNEPVTLSAFSTDEQGNATGLQEKELKTSDPSSQYAVDYVVESRTTPEQLSTAQITPLNNSYSIVQWKVLIASSATSLHEYATIGSINLIDKVLPVDLNGDGLADLVYRQKSDRRWFVRINNGNGFNAAINTGIVDADMLKFVDVHGDGRLQIVHKVDSNFRLYALENSQFVWRTWFADSVGRDYWSTAFIDMNGNGTPDVLDFNGRYNLTFRADSGKDKLVSVVNGFNEQLLVGYATLARSGVHIRKSDGPSKNWGNGHLVRDIKGAIPVVRTLTNSVDSLTYQYTGGKMQVGRGMLGYEQVQITSAAGIRTTTTYRQDGDFRGSVAEVVVEVKVGETAPPVDPCSIDPYLCYDPCPTPERCLSPLQQQEYTLQDMGVQQNSASNYGPIWRQQSRTTSNYALRSNTAFSTNSNKTQARFVYPTSQTTVRYDTDQSGSVILSTQTQVINSIDAFGQPLTQTEMVVDAYVNAQTTTTNTYTYNETGLYGGRLAQSTVRKERTNIVNGSNSAQPVITLSNQFTYDSAGRLTSQTSDSGIVTSYTLNNFGLITAETVSANGMLSRTVNRSYDTQGRYLVSETNALGQTTSYSYNTQGLLSYTQYANGQRVYLDYNSLGRLIRETTTPANNTSKTGAGVLISSKTQYWCHSGISHCPANATYYEETIAPGQPASRLYSDQVGRQVRQATQGFNGQWVYADTVFGSYGRKLSETVPYYAGTGSPAQARFDYDMQGRLSKITKPDGSVWLTSYNGLSTINTAPNNAMNIEVNNSLGELVAVTDADGNRAWYQYDANGKSTVLAGPSGKQLVVSYDKWGNKTRINDPDAGITNYSYNAFHELISQSDANGNVITYTYDLLGRQLTMLRQKGSATEHNVETVYDSGAYAIGQVSSVEDKQTGFRVNYYYDAFARKRQQTTSFDLASYQQYWSYDSLGRLLTETDATGGGLTYHYTATHWLNAIDDKDIKASSGAALRYWQANAQDAFGNVTQDKLGQAITRSKTYHQHTGLLTGITSSSPGQGNLQNWIYQWDALGNLQYRQDQVTGNRENFTYDLLNRVRTSRISSSHGSTNVDINYNALGNITFKTGVGNYFYESGRPHAVTRVTGARANNYQYDANGNMVQDNQRQLTYNSFNKPTRISKAGYQVEFSYDAFGNRYKRSEFGGQQGQLIPIISGGITTFIPLTTETRYIGNVELVRKGGNEWLQRRYVGDKAVVSKLASQSAAQSVVRFMLSDHLGSTHVITNNNGVSEQVMSFDVFGARRDAQSWALKHAEASSGLLSSSLTLKGFTGHEQIDDVGLVHMGGRVYDPILGRFLQADPFVQQPNNTQNLNRYSYVLNNPLNATDPSGYFFQMLAMWAVQYIAAATATSAIGTALGVALQAYSYYGYAQMAVGAIRAIEGGGTAMANFAGGMAKGYAKSMLFNGAMKGLSQLAGGQRPANSPDAPQEVSNTQGSNSADGHTASGESGHYLGDTDRAALAKSLDTLNQQLIKRMESGLFKSHKEAAEWLHDNGFVLTEQSGAEIYARIFERADGFAVGTVITSYHTSRIDVVDMSRSVSSGRLVADWHTHPAVGAANFSQQDYQTRLDRYVSFKDYWNPSSGLRHYDGFKAWSTLGYNPSPALPDMTLDHGDKFSSCIKGGC
ncbi:MAG: FG-GAP-like repeat-containing protein [Alishewanella aestuarii]